MLLSFDLTLYNLLSRLSAYTSYPVKRKILYTIAHKTDKYIYLYLRKEIFTLRIYTYTPSIWENEYTEFKYLHTKYHRVSALEGLKEV